VLKIPDSSFSRGVKRANFEELKTLATEWLEESDLLIAQEYLPTDFDWRIGVLGGQPLFAVQYLMVKKHWQIVNHDRRGGRCRAAFALHVSQMRPPRSCRAR
jgi:glutathione synthase/RimK-type ligase-like ATP-grasp enzyme